MLTTCVSIFSIKPNCTSSSAANARVVHLREALERVGPLEALGDLLERTLARDVDELPEHRSCQEVRGREQLAECRVPAL